MARRGLQAAVRLLLAAGLTVATASCSGNESQPDRSPSPVASPAPRTAPAYDSTKPRSELVGSLPVLRSATEAGKRVIFSQQVEVHPGQILLAVAEWQVTNDLDANVYVGSAVLLADSASGVTGRSITEANGENVTPDMHHGQQTKSGTYRARRADAGVRYVNLVAWAASSNAPADSVVTVNQGYGRLSVLRW